MPLTRISKRAEAFSPARKETTMSEQTLTCSAFFGPQAKTEQLNDSEEAAALAFVHRIPTIDQ
ncbi:hypothetical protein [Paenibacillus sp. BK033]|uniref:hypothetical protein n=1 Tax=Paenibacillus sp. BK033 TaxID=2512133 RepID=UPI001050F9DC|nr:hypothetical protein [Paenibacillus sp. BK033]